jgi:hypothetical protein
VASWPFFWEHQKTMSVNKQKVAESLRKADSETIKIVISDAESYLKAQLQAGLAADLRAMTFAAVLAAIVSILIGGVASLIANKVEIWPHVLPVSVIVVGLCFALGFAVYAARPTDFFFAGNNPKNWVPDVDRGMGLTRSLADQAAVYAVDIEKNEKILSDNHRFLKFALLTSVASTVLGALLEGVLVLQAIKILSLPF